MLIPGSSKTLWLKGLEPAPTMGPRVQVGSGTRPMHGEGATHQKTSGFSSIENPCREKGGIFFSLFWIQVHFLQMGIEIFRVIIDE